MLLRHRDIRHGAVAVLDGTNYPIENGYVSTDNREHIEQLIKHGFEPATSPAARTVREAGSQATLTEPVTPTEPAPSARRGEVFGEDAPWPDDEPVVIEPEPELKVEDAPWPDDEPVVIEPEPELKPEPTVRVIKPPKSDQSAGLCAGVTKTGAPCRLRAITGSDYCHLHQAQGEVN